MFTPQLSFPVHSSPKSSASWFPAPLACYFPYLTLQQDHTPASVPLTPVFPSRPPSQTPACAECSCFKACIPFAYQGQTHFPSPTSCFRPAEVFCILLVNPSTSVPADFQKRVLEKEMLSGRAEGQGVRLKHVCCMLCVYVSGSLKVGSFSGGWGATAR